MHPMQLNNKDYKEIEALMAFDPNSTVAPFFNYSVFFCYASDGFVKRRL